MKWIANMLGGGVLEGANKLAKTFVGDKSAREKGELDQNAAFLAMVSGETPKTGRTWWDSFVDGLNRLVRPVFTFGTLWMFVYCVADPQGFALAMASLDLMPQEGWYLVGAIIGFWFTGKFVGQISNKPRPVDPEALERVMRLQRQHEEEKAKERELKLSGAVARERDEILKEAIKKTQAS